MEISDTLKKYVDILLEYNQKINLISRKITPENLIQLIKETYCLDRYISNDIVIDAGSGNGILGIPIAIIKKNWKIILVESKIKKAGFLMEVKKRMELSNVVIKNVSIEEYLNCKQDEKKILKTLITRGFPQINAIFSFVKKGLIGEAVLITSENKIKKNAIYLESLKKKTYNVPLRRNLKILKIERQTNYR